MQISSSTEVGAITAVVAGITYFVGAVGGSLSPEVAAGLSAVAAGLSAFLTSGSLATTASAASTAQAKT